jgi:hypothetical protein
MRKNRKKLTLAKETVRTLSPSSLAEANGAGVATITVLCTLICTTVCSSDCVSRRKGDSCNVLMCVGE